MRYCVSKPELETICLMTLRQSLSAVRRVSISLVNSSGAACNWEVRHIEPMPSGDRLEGAMANIQQLQMTFNVDPLCVETGHGGFKEAAV